MKKISFLVLSLVCIITFFVGSSGVYAYNNSEGFGYVETVYKNDSGYKKSDRSKDYSAWELVKDMNPGWSLGNSLEICNQTYGYVEDYLALERTHANPNVTRTMIHAVKEKGFKSIRIPVSYFHHLLESKDNTHIGTRAERAGETIDPRWFDRVEEVVQWALDEDLYVIINVHHDTGMGYNRWIYSDHSDEIYSQSSKALSNLWGRIADRFKDYDERLIFQATGEILNGNDKSDAFGAALYKDYQATHDLSQEFINIVRNSGGRNVDRFLMLQTYGSNASPYIVDQLFYKDFEDSATDKLIFGIHNYSTDIEGIEQNFKENYKRAVKYGVPFIVDEFGTQARQYTINGETFTNAEGVSLEIRKEVNAKYIEMSKKYGMAAIVWDDGAKSFGLYDRSKNTFVGKGEEEEEIIDAMFDAYYNTDVLTDDELKDASAYRLDAIEFEGLNSENYKKTTQFGRYFTYGQYAEVDAKANSPLVIFDSSIKYHAALKPYVYSDKARFIANLPEGVAVVVREMDKDGNFMQNKYVTASGGWYVPSANAVYSAIYFRTHVGTKLTFKDFENLVKSNELRLKSPEEKIYVKNVDIDKTSVVINKDDILRLNAEVLPVIATDKTVTWKSSDNGIATVDENGNVMGIKQGVAKITVTTNDGKKTATANVRVLFDDVKKGHIFYNPIYWAADNGVTYGVTGTNNFAPSSTVTRGQVIAFLYRMDGNPKTTGYKNLFKDVTSKSTFYNPILWGGKSQVVAGYPDGTFREKVTCTRGQIVAFIWRMAGKPEPATKKSSFKDVNTKNTFYKAILWAAENGITVGYNDGTFRSGGNCTRGQMVAFLQRFAKQYPSKVKL